MWSFFKLLQKAFILLKKNIIVPVRYLFLLLKHSLRLVFGWSSALEKRKAPI